ncbi:MAG: hypothetical protein Q4C47_03960 [Planctomycetia bacterium]|nr:hypothetical protein [Planctomycetia bacterium]
MSVASVPATTSLPSLLSDDRGELNGSGSIHNRWVVIAEILGIFFIFAVQAFWSVPDVNEPCYVGKAIRFWNPTWARGDFFLESANPHAAYYVAFGWLTLWISPIAFTWTMRFVSWILLAWSWRRLSVTILPHIGASVLTAGLFAYFTENTTLAGEWIIGGTESKVLAYVAVLFAMSEIMRGHWNRGWILIGLGSLFHVLVGGWAGVILGGIWCFGRITEGSTAGRKSTGNGTTEGKGLEREAIGETSVVRRKSVDGESATQERIIDQSPTFPRLRTMFPGLVLGGLIALPGLWLSLDLNAGVAPEIATKADYISVYRRLPFHLYLHGMDRDRVIRFFWLVAAFGLLGGLQRWRNRHRSGPRQWLDRFSLGTLLLVMVGGFWSWYALRYKEYDVAAGFLKFYWFRLADIFVPAGVAIRLVSLVYISAPRTIPTTFPSVSSVIPSPLHSTSPLHHSPIFRETVRTTPPRTSSGTVPTSHPQNPSGTASSFRPESWGGRGLRYATGIGVSVFVLWYVGTMAYGRITDGDVPPRSEAKLRPTEWLAACEWIRDSGEIPTGARFLTPRENSTFTWRTGHPQVVTRKDFPQDARAIVEWYARLQEIFSPHPKRAWPNWYRTLSERKPEDLRQLGRKYAAPYLLVETGIPLPFDELYRNERYVVYRMF